MRTLRIAVASIPLTATLDEAVPAAVAAVAEAGRLGARIVCLPETALPGHRMQARAVENASQQALDAAMQTVAEAARAARVVALVGTERVTPAGREIVQVVLDANGARLGEQAKTQMHATEEEYYVIGAGRRVFTAGGATFGIAICHEVFRYPEIVRALVLAGAQILFAPHYVTANDGKLPASFADAANSYNEKALVCRAIENTVFVAAANCATPDQASATCIIAPDGKLLASVPYGKTGVAVADVDLEHATRLYAERWAPARNVVA